METRNGSGGKAISVAVIGTGEMGSATSKRLAERGARIKTSLKGRSAASRERIQKLGIPFVEDDAALVEGVEIILSIIPPGEAVAVAEQFAPFLQAAKVKPIFVDCNAVSPQTTERIAAIVKGAGAEFVDGGIIGTPPKDPYSPVYFVSGPQAERVLALRDAGLEVRLAGDAIGDASALKLSYAGMTKGFTSIATTMFTAAIRCGVADKLAAILEETQPGFWDTMRATVPRMPAKAYRWVAEMREIGAYAAPDGIGAEIYEAVATLYERIAAKYAAEGMADGTLLERLKAALSEPVASKK